jgi:hypothetical protein
MKWRFPSKTVKNFFDQAAPQRAAHWLGADAASNFSQESELDTKQLSAKVVESPNSSSEKIEAVHRTFSQRSSDSSSSSEHNDCVTPSPPSGRRYIDAAFSWAHKRSSKSETSYGWKTFDFGADIVIKSKKPTLLQRWRNNQSEPSQQSLEQVTEKIEQHMLGSGTELRVAQDALRHANGYEAHAVHTGSELYAFMEHPLVHTGSAFEGLVDTQATAESDRLMMVYGEKFDALGLKVMKLYEAECMVRSDRHLLIKHKRQAEVSLTHLGVERITPYQHAQVLEMETDKKQYRLCMDLLVKSVRAQTQAKDALSVATNKGTGSTKTSREHISALKRALEAANNEFASPSTSLGWLAVWKNARSSLCNRCGYRSSRITPRNY